MPARRCGCRHARVFADDPDRCHRCGRLLRDWWHPRLSDLEFALARLLSADREPIAPK